MTLLVAVTTGQSRPKSDDGVLTIPQSSNDTGTSPSDCLVSYSRHSLGESYPSAGLKLVYSAAPDHMASFLKCITDNLNKLI